MIKSVDGLSYLFTHSSTEFFHCDRSLGIQREPMNCHVSLTDTYNEIRIKEKKRLEIREVLIALRSCPETFPAILYRSWLND